MRYILGIKYKIKLLIILKGLYRVIGFQLKEANRKLLISLNIYKRHKKDYIKPTSIRSPIF